MFQLLVWVTPLHCWTQLARTDLMCAMRIIFDATKEYWPNARVVRIEDSFIVCERHD